MNEMLHYHTIFNRLSRGVYYNMMVGRICPVDQSSINIMVGHDPVIRLSLLYSFL